MWTFNTDWLRIELQATFAIRIYKFLVLLIFTQIFTQIIKEVSPFVHAHPPPSPGEPSWFLKAKFLRGCRFRTDLSVSEGQEKQAKIVDRKSSTELIQKTLRALQLIRE